MEIDHVFFFVASPASGKAPELPSLAALGLVPTYQRHHRGQGTQNLCYCFDNLFVEFLWVCDQSEVSAHQIARTKLCERSRWQSNQTCPFGIAWRGAEAHRDLPIATWNYQPPYLPSGMAIEVATDGDDPRQPMMFKSPGGTPPISWAVDKKGCLQQAGGWGRVLGIDLFMPSTVVPSPALLAIAEQTMLTLQVASDDQFSIHLQIEQLASLQSRVLKLPA